MFITKEKFLKNILLIQFYPGFLVFMKQIL